MRVIVLVVVVVVVVTGGKQSQLLVLSLSLKFDNILRLKSSKIKNRFEAWLKNVYSYKK